MMYHQSYQDFVDGVHAKTWKSWGRVEKRGGLRMKDRLKCWRLADLALMIILAESVLAALTRNGRSQTLIIDDIADIADVGSENCDKIY